MMVKNYGAQLGVNLLASGFSSLRTLTIVITCHNLFWIGSKIQDINAKFLHQILRSPFHNAIWTAEEASCEAEKRLVEPRIERLCCRLI